MTPQTEAIVKAARCAELLARDILEAHGIACSGNQLLQIMLLDALADAWKLKSRLQAIQAALESE